MAYMAASAGAAAAQEAMKALIGGLLVEVEPEMFISLASEHGDRICVSGEVGTIRKKRAYALSIDGLVLLTKTGQDISVRIPNRQIRAREISIPSV
jgi:hypothetical protein